MDFLPMMTSLVVPSEVKEGVPTDMFLESAWDTPVLHELKHVVT